MSKTLKTVATIAAGVALVATGVGAIAGADYYSWRQRLVALPQPPH